MKLALGTVQFGLDYGVSNFDGRPGTAEVAQILEIAEKNNINLIDTAIGYGNSHNVLNDHHVAKRDFNLITKLPPLNKAYFEKSDVDHYLQYIESAFEELGADSLYGVLFHQSADLLKPGVEAIWQRLTALQSEKKISKLGVSMYANADCKQLLSLYQLDLVQLPYNILDRYFEQTGWLAQFRQRGIEVHARSIFLQGLLLMESDKVPPYFKPWISNLEQISKLAETFNTSKLVISLAYVLQQKAIDHCVVGVNKARELTDILSAFENAIDIASSDLPDLSVDDLALTNPALWP